MDYRHERFFKDLLVNETYYIAIKDRKMVRRNVEDDAGALFWTRKELAEAYFENRTDAYDKIITRDLDRFVTSELDDLFDKGDKVLVNVTDDVDGHFIDIYETTDKLMTELDRIRVVEFSRITAKSDDVFGLTHKGNKQFIIISDNGEDKPNLMPVWSDYRSALKVRDEDFEECDVEQVEGEVFSEWLEQLRDEDRAVGVNLKPGVVGSIVSAQTLKNELSY
ncbi:MULTISPECIES: DUF2750 domain-containing protein [Staphylococcus]|uniref:DUF2750 domain-containing protein n=1 Tax=Staphylococcus TaxID=1279 RepID=UPI0021CF5230|nr:DUF2750 domain-containing protein [Staphylococcus sp. IVB6181]UXV35761.1 DUF2750 domain-containing protein [Staphylococcus sp. IVB6181]